MAERLRLLGEPSAEALAACADGALRVTDAAAFLGVSRSKIYELVRSGALCSARVGGRRVVLRASAQALLARSIEP